MKHIFSGIWMAVCLLLCEAAAAQQISYSQPEREDSRNAAFEIIGKVGGNILVYKNNRSSDAISIYNNNMELLDRASLKFRYDLLNVDFISYPDKFLMIYQFQHRQYVYCYGMAMDGNAKIIGSPVLIDSTQVGAATVKNKLYSIAYSENKKEVLVYKINQNKELTNIFYTFLLDDNLNLINNSRVALPMESKRDYLSSFSLSNEGDFVFVKVEKSNAKDFAGKAWMVVKPAVQDTFYVTAMDFKSQYIDEFRLKLDNENKKVYAASFYYTRKRSDVDGIYFVRFDYTAHTLDEQHFITFDDKLKANARNSSPKGDAFNDYFLRQLVIKSDGGFLVTAESFYSNSQYSPWNRWDYLYGPYTSYYSPYYYYSPFSPWYYSPFSRNYQGREQFHYNDIAVLSYDGQGKLEWSNFIRKEQYDDETDDFLSYALMNIGSELHFLYNDPYRRSYILTDVSITPEGKLSKEPTFRNLDKGYEWMPRYGKQVSANETVIPCVYRNFICFAKINF